MRKVTSYFEDVDGVECEITWTPVEFLDQHKARVGDKLVFAYCVEDHDYRDIDDMIGDCMGKLYSFHRHSSRDDHRAGLEALGNDRDGNADLDKVWEQYGSEATDRYTKRVLHIVDHKDIIENFELMDSDYERRDDETDFQTAQRYLICDVDDASNWGNVEYYDDMETVLEEMWNEPAYFPGDRYARVLACYEHGGQVWSLSGQGMQCRWDTSNQAGVWVPDEYLIEHIESFDEDKRDAKATEFCKQFLETYNDIINGNVWGCVVEWFGLDGKPIDNEACWGFLGDEHAEEALKFEFFDPVCRRLTKEQTCTS